MDGFSEFLKALAVILASVIIVRAALWFAKWLKG